MRNPARYRRTAAAICLALAGVMCAVFMVLSAASGWGSDHGERLQAIAEAGTPATVSFLAFAGYQLPMVIGLLGVAHLLRGSNPVLSNVGATLAAIGGFGYAVYGGSQLVIPAMAADQPNLELYAQLRLDAEALTGPFAALGMVGSVLGLLLLSIALWRAKLGPRMVPVLLWVFLVVEFIGTSVVPGASVISAGLFLIVLLVLAVTVWRSPTAAWSSGADGPTRTGVGVTPTDLASAATGAC